MRLEEFTVIIPPSELALTMATSTANILAVVPCKTGYLVKGFASVSHDRYTNSHLPTACHKYGYSGSSLITTLSRYRQIRTELLNQI